MEERDDRRVKEFIVRGYVQLAPTLCPDAHAEIAAQIAACGLQEPGSPEDIRAGRRDPYGLRQLDGAAAGNNLLHAAPALRGPACLESPELVATLSRLLGPDYRIHPHCRGHLRQKTAKTSMWHVDAYKGLPWCSGRQHEPHWVMIMYYPQETTADMGPTQLLPGSQYYRGDSDRQHYSRGHIPDFSEQLDAWATVVDTVVGPAGTIVVMHYDLWHRALASASDKPRLMLKFVACRTGPPPQSTLARVPSWRLAYDTSMSGESEGEGSCGVPSASHSSCEGRILDFLSGDAPGIEAADIEHTPRTKEWRQQRRKAKDGKKPQCAPYEPNQHGSGTGCGAESSDRYGPTDRAAQSNGGAAAPTGHGVSTDGARHSEPSLLPPAAVRTLEAHLESMIALGPMAAWRNGIDLLTSKGALEAEKRLFASAVNEAKRSHPSGGGAKGALGVALGSDAERNNEADGEDGDEEGEVSKSTPLVQARQLPAVIAWLTPRCRAYVRRVAEHERRARFLRDRRPIWRHVWAWLHGCVGAGASCETARTSPQQEDVEGLLVQVRSSAEPTRLRAAYELGEGGAAGATALLQVLADATASTSVRRTAMYGLVAARGLTMDGLPPVLMGRCPPEHPSASSPPTSELHGAAEGKSMDTAEGRAGAEGVDPILRLSAPPDPERWLSASLLRSVEGFDAECLLAAADPAAEISYLATLVLARSASLREGDGALALQQQLARILEPAAMRLHTCLPKGGATAEMVVHLEEPGADLELQAPPSACLVALEAVGVLGALPASRASCPPFAALLARTLACPHADASSRAIAARSLAQLSAQGSLLSCGDNGDSSVETLRALAGALLSDGDRYVRGYAAEALASALMVGSGSEAESLEISRQALAAAITPEDVASAEKTALIERIDIAEGGATAQATSAAPAAGARWLCQRRWCPLTTPLSPF